MTRTKGFIVKYPRRGKTPSSQKVMKGITVFVVSGAQGTGKSTMAVSMLMGLHKLTIHRRSIILDNGLCDDGEMALCKRPKFIIDMRNTDGPLTISTEVY